MNFIAFFTRRLLAAGLLLAGGSLSAQSFSASVLASGGGTYGSSDFLVSFTIGEIAVKTHLNSGAYALEGFQQPYVISGPLTALEPTDPGAFRLFPNPVQGVLQVEGPGLSAQTVGVLFDLQGREWRLQPVDFAPDSPLRFQVAHVPSGFYLLRLEAQGRLLFGKKILLMP